MYIYRLLLIRLWLAAFDFCAGLRYLCSLVGSRRAKIAFLCWLSLFNFGLGMDAVAQSGSGISNGAAISNGAKIIPPSQALCVITTNSLPGGTVGVFYSQTIQTSNCAAPVTFSISAGALPTWITTVWPNTTGKIEGTPGAPDGGTSASFTVTATDANGHAASFIAGFNIPAVPGGGAPTLPDPALMSWCTTIACTPAPNTVITIGDTPGTALCPTTCNFTSSQLQTAINSLTCGQHLRMENQVYSAVNLTIAQKCDNAHWIFIERDPNDATFPPEGTKVDPCYMGIPQNKMPYHAPYPLADLTPNTCPARRMPYIQSTAAGSYLIKGSFIRFVGIEWGRNNSYDLNFVLISMNNSTACNKTADNACIAAQANHIIFDRNEMHGDAQRQTVRALGLGGVQWVALLDSDIYDIGATFAGNAADAQAISWGAADYITNVGWAKIHNNTLSASTMCFLTGGGNVEPLSPLTGFDGIPHDMWWSQNWCWKNPLWDTQIGQTQGTSISIEGQNYGPAPDQELTQVPSAIQLAVGQVYEVQTWTAHDSRAGINRTPSDLTTATNTLNGSASTCNVQTVNGFVCTVFGNVGSGVHFSANQFTTKFTAPLSIPAGGTVNYTRCFTTNDGRLATLGNNRQLCASTLFTIVASNPVHAMVVGPVAPDIQIQPSYSDASGNLRQFCLEFNAIPNFTSSGTTWDVDGVVDGDTTRGTIDSQGLYCSPSTAGSHTIHAVASDGTTGSSAIAVSNSAPIVETDGRAYTSKNGWELKEGVRILLENFLLTLAWGSQGVGGGQGGQMLLTHPLNQNGCPGNCNDGNGVNVGYGPQVLDDFTGRYIKGSNFGAGFVIGGASVSRGTHRVSMTHALCVDCSKKHWSHGFSNSYFATQANTGPDTAGVTVDTITAVGSTVTLTTLTPHGLLAASHFCIAGLVCGVVDSVPNGSTFVFTQAGLTNCSHCGEKVHSIYSWMSNSVTMQDDVVYRHITIVGDYPNTFGENGGVLEPKGNNYVIQDSIIASPNSTTFLNPNGVVPGAAGNCNQATGSGSSNTEALAFIDCFNTYTFDHLALLDSTASPSVFLSSPIWQPASNDAGLFRNYNNGLPGGDLRVVAGGAYDAGGARQASDGTALGADITGINAMESNVRNGTRTP